MRFIKSATNQVALTANNARLRKLFHSNTKAEAPRDKERAKIVTSLMQKAVKDEQGKIYLTFHLNGGFKVCAPTIFRFLGLSKSVDLRDAPRPVARLTKAHINGDSEQDQATLFSEEELKADTEDSCRVK